MFDKSAIIVSENINGNGSFVSMAGRLRAIADENIAEKRMLRELTETF